MIGRWEARMVRYVMMHGALMHDASQIQPMTLGPRCSNSPGRRINRSEQGVARSAF